VKFFGRHVTPIRPFGASAGTAPVLSFFFKAIGYVYEDTISNRPALGRDIGEFPILRRLSSKLTDAFHISLPYL
jgi:hypothetical protein